MGWRFRKSIKILPGVRVNIGKKGISSVSVGRRGASINVGKRGTHANVGIPGSGLSYRTRIGGGNRNQPNGQQGQSKTGCLPLILVVIGLSVLMNFIFSGSSDKKNDTVNTVKAVAPAVQKAKPALPAPTKSEESSDEAGDEFKPIPYLGESESIKVEEKTDAQLIAERKAYNQELKRQWRENDTQIQGLLSKGNSGSSSYYAPPSGNYSSSSSPSREKTVYVEGYYRKDGTYVEPHMRSRPSR
ncbi:hypothetical protein ADP71_31850 [Vitreoscilla sp. C1]|uniref:DUF4236 domain-containing protein n=1 Tax=Vitreoscilla sp. (strain C1) TaxID=96942 RepID=UPI00148EDA78|nr:DUF4236 domain-containing protein [Vitreoscilla sp. C1]AUZ06363.2 hypothetical protein ADP71_31850 [Vitreoscilla sp. C1]